MIHLSVVIPVYNEEPAIQDALRRVEAFLTLKPWEWEIIVSDDGSRDGTAQKIREYREASRHRERIQFLSATKNLGKGAAVRRGVLEARGRHVLVTDADLSAPIKEVDKLLKALEEGVDVAIGSRALREPGCDVQQSLKRWLAGRIFNTCVRWLVIGGYTDTQCGFKCFRREAAMELFHVQSAQGFSFDVEILYRARLLSFRVREVPIMWRQAPQSRIRLFRDSIGMLKELWRLRRHYRIGRGVRG